jgi:hypothetical protein
MDNNIYKKMFSIFISTFIFSIIYYYLGKKHIFYNSSTSDSYLNTLYFSCMTQTLLGDSVMAPITSLSKFIVSIQAFSTFIFLN